MFRTVLPRRYPVQPGHSVRRFEGGGFLPFTKVGARRIIRSQQPRLTYWFSRVIWSRPPGSSPLRSCSSRRTHRRRRYSGEYDGNCRYCSKKTGRQGIPLHLGRHGPRQQDRARRDECERRSAGQRDAAPPGHQGRRGQEAADAPRRRDHRQGHHALHPPARHHVEVGRAAPAGVRHRRQGPQQSLRREAPPRHQDRGGDRVEPQAGLREASALLRRALLQPDRRRGAGGDTGQPARPAGDVQGKNSRDQEQDQVRAVLPGRHSRRRVRDHRHHHDFRDPGVQTGVRELRRGTAGHDARRHGDIGLLRGGPGTRSSAASASRSGSSCTRGSAP